MSKKLTVSIVVIGSEITSGKIQDGHGKFLSSRLSKTSTGPSINPSTDPSMFSGNQLDTNNYKKPIPNSLKKNE